MEKISRKLLHSDENLEEEQDTGQFKIRYAQKWAIAIYGSLSSWWKQSESQRRQEILFQKSYHAIINKINRLFAILAILKRARTN